MIQAGLYSSVLSVVGRGKQVGLTAAPLGVAQLHTYLSVPKRPGVIRKPTAEN